MHIILRNAEVLVWQFKQWICILGIAHASAQKITETIKSLKICHLININHIHFKIVCGRTKITRQQQVSRSESRDHWMCCWWVASTSTACVRGGGGYFEHMQSLRWCDVTRVTFWEKITVTRVCRYSVNRFSADSCAIQYEFIVVNAQITISEFHKVVHVTVVLTSNDWNYSHLCQVSFYMMLRHLRAKNY